MWHPISFEKLKEKILEGERRLESDLYAKELIVFWRNIKINPEKWDNEDGYGKETGGFFVVCFSGRRVIWYNDIEEGFNISFFNEYGLIRDYGCEQYDLNHAVYQLYY